MKYGLRSLDRFSLYATARRASIHALMVLCALASLSLSACGGADYRSYPYFDRVEIVAASAPLDMPLAKSKIAMAKKVPEDTAKKTAWDAGLGLALSAACGPMFVTCAEIFVPAMVEDHLERAPLVAGLSIVAGMSEEETEQVNDYFEALPKRRNLNQELVMAVSASLPGARLATADGDARLTLGMRRILFFQEPNNLFTLFQTFEANMEWGLGKKKQDNAQRTYNCFTEYQTPETWLADSGRKFDEAFDLCLNTVSQQIKTAVMKKNRAGRA